MDSMIPVFSSQLKGNKTKKRYKGAAIVVDQFYDAFMWISYNIYPEIQYYRLAMILRIYQETQDLQ